MVKGKLGGGNHPLVKTRLLRLLGTPPTAPTRCDLGMKIVEILDELGLGRIVELVQLRRSPGAFIAAVVATMGDSGQSNTTELS
jgi:hypothetical protein